MPLHPGTEERVKLNTIIPAIVLSLVLTGWAVHYHPFFLALGVPLWAVVVTIYKSRMQDVRQYEHALYKTKKKRLEKDLA